MKDLLSTTPVFLGSGRLVGWMDGKKAAKDNLYFFFFS